MLIASIKQHLNELLDLLSQLKNEEYSKPCLYLNHSTIGEHTRHIIEHFQCLVNHYDSGVINYDSRKRDYQIQTDVVFAKKSILDVLHIINKPDKNIQLQHTIFTTQITTESNYFRELLYNLEHCIHHQALIKVALIDYKHIQIDTNFGVANSTIEYKKQCAQ